MMPPRLRRPEPSLPSAPPHPESSGKRPSPQPRTPGAAVGCSSTLSVHRSPICDCRPRCQPTLIGSLFSFSSFMSRANFSILHPSQTFCQHFSFVMNTLLFVLSLFADWTLHPLVVAPEDTLSLWSPQTCPVHFLISYKTLSNFIFSLLVPLSDMTGRKSYSLIMSNLINDTILFVILFVILNQYLFFWFL